MPSPVEVPRPSSSMMTRLARRLLRHDLDVHHLDHERTLPADQIIGSADPREDPVGDRNRAELAGTKQPICAIRQITATCRIYVLLPAMFGPGNEQNDAALSCSRLVSFAMNEPSWMTASTTG